MYIAAVSSMASRAIRFLTRPLVEKSAFILILPDSYYSLIPGPPIMIAGRYLLGDCRNKTLDGIRAQLSARPAEVDIAAMRGPRQGKEKLRAAIRGQPNGKTLALFLPYQFIPSTVDQKGRRGRGTHEVKW